MGKNQPVKFLEKTLTQYYQQFKLENPAVTVGQTADQKMTSPIKKCKIVISSTETGVLLHTPC